MQGVSPTTASNGEQGRLGHHRPQEHGISCTILVSPSAFLERRIYPRNTLSIANGSTWNIPCADFFYMRNVKIERFDCYPALNIILKQMGVPPDFASAVKRSTQR